MRNSFWNFWRKDYLSSLRECNRGLQGSSKSNHRSSHIEEGDVVIVEDARVPRLFWKLGIVKRLLNGRDGNTRVAEIDSLSRKLF